MPAPTSLFCTVWLGDNLNRNGPEHELGQCRNAGKPRFHVRNGGQSRRKLPGLVRRGLRFFKRTGPEREIRPHQASLRTTHAHPYFEGLPLRAGRVRSRRRRGETSTTFRHVVSDAKAVLRGRKDLAVRLGQG